MTRDSIRQGLVELAERCERAVSSDRELDCLIHCAHEGLDFVCLATGNEIYGDICDPSDSGYGTNNKTSPGLLYARYPDHKNLPTLGGGKRGNIVQGCTPPAYTASIDAAMSLVPEGMKFILDTHHMIVTIYEYWPISSPEDEGFASYQAEAATPALALVAAALRAKAQS